MKKYIILLLTLLLMVASMSIVLADSDNLIQPRVIWHYCHSGVECRECDVSSLDLPCGCESDRYDCCCGKTMRVVNSYCQQHAY
jgi:hypothetical protein